MSAEGAGTCPQHGAPAMGACARCGRFVCAQCARAGRDLRCEACAAREPKPLLSDAREVTRLVREALSSYARALPLVLLVSFGVALAQLPANRDFPELAGTWRFLGVLSGVLGQLLHLGLCCVVVRRAGPERPGGLGRVLLGLLGAALLTLVAQGAFLNLCAVPITLASGGESIPRLDALLSSLAVGFSFASTALFMLEAAALALHGPRAWRELRRWLSGRWTVALVLAIAILLLGNGFHEAASRLFSARLTDIVQGDGPLHVRAAAFVARDGLGLSVNAVRAAFGLALARRLRDTAGTAE